jgi:hypothetical protein
LMSGCRIGVVSLRWSEKGRSVYLEMRWSRLESLFGNLSGLIKAKANTKTKAQKTLENTVQWDWH